VAPTLRETVAPSGHDLSKLLSALPPKTRAKLDRLRDLMSHAIPSRNSFTVLDRALDMAIAAQEKRKYGATAQPRAPRAQNTDGPYVSMHVRRVVRERDGDRCTHVSDDGQRCPATAFVEFDHIVPRSQGGKSTADNLRLRCRAHNQHAAEVAFGRPFIRAKREEARRASADRRERRKAEVGARKAADAETRHRAGASAAAAASP
jgi:hypothetical protein